MPNLRDPQRFTELVQHRKLYDRNPMMPILADKVAAKKYVARQIGADWTIPTYWSGTQLPDEPSWPYPFILKASHGCNQNIICHNLMDWKKAKRRARKWVRRPYGLWLDEWAYRDIGRAYIAEPFLGSAGKLPVDYKIYAFGGKAVFVQVHLSRATDHRWIMFDPNWHQISMFGETNLPLAPKSLKAMLESAEKLTKDFDFARIDFYEIGDQPKFGEVTFYPGSGLDPFDPLELDLAIGTYWLAERQNYENKTRPQGVIADSPVFV